MGFISIVCVGFRKRKRTISATLPAELRQMAADKDCVPASPLLGYDPHRSGRGPPPDNNDLSTEGYDLVYGSSPHYGNPVLDYPGSPQQYHADVFHEDSNPQQILTDVELTTYTGSGAECEHPPPLYVPRERKAPQDSGGPAPGLSTHDSGDYPTSRTTVSMSQEEHLDLARGSGALQDNDTAEHRISEMDLTEAALDMPYTPSSTGILQSHSPPSPRQEDVQLTDYPPQTQEDTSSRADLQPPSTSSSSSLSQDNSHTTKVTVTLD